MAERPTQSPEIPVRTLGGLNERPSKANLRSGEFSALEGLYPSSVGLQSRIPGKVAVDLFSGVVLQIADTLNTNGDVLYQVGENLYASTIDEIQGRAVTPDLVYSPDGEEENMSLAIIVQREASGVNGGSLHGWISGTDPGTSPTGSILNTFYNRRLTDMLVNESSIVTTFTASSSGAGAPSTDGTFALAPGDYRITVYAVYSATGIDVVVGLFNVTSSAFEVYSGTSDAVVATISFGTSGSANVAAYLDAKITVSSSTKTFAIQHQCSNTTSAKTMSICGTKTTATATILGVAPKNTYCIVKILKTA